MEQEMKILSKQFFNEVAAPNMTLLIVVMTIGMVMSIDMMYLVIDFVFRIVSSWLH